MPGPRRRPRDDARSDQPAYPFWDRDGVHDVYRRWRAVADEYDATRSFVAEILVPRARAPGPLRAPGRAAHRVRLPLPRGPGTPAALRTADRRHLPRSAGRERRRPGSCPTTTSPRDAPARRSAGAHRPGGTGGGPRPHRPRLGPRRARAAALLMLALPGCAYLYQGEELGLAEVEDLPDRARRTRPGCAPGTRSAGATAAGFPCRGRGPRRRSGSDRTGRTLAAATRRVAVGDDGGANRRSRFLPRAVPSRVAAATGASRLPWLGPRLAALPAVRTAVRPARWARGGGQPRLGADRAARRTTGPALERAVA